MTYGSECLPLLADVGLKFERVEMQMIRWMCGISMKDRRANEELRKLVGVEPMLLLLAEMNFIKTHDSYKKLRQKYWLYNYCTYCIIQQVIL